jgi:hypothetical protein
LLDRFKYESVEPCRLFLTCSETNSEPLEIPVNSRLVQRTDFEAFLTGAIKEALAEEDRILLDRFKYESVEPAVSGSTVAIVRTPAAVRTGGADCS